MDSKSWFGERHTINDEFSSDMIVPLPFVVIMIIKV
jgi:hypothetical protein